MLHKKFIPALLMAVILLYSCGPSKKMKAANAQIETLKAENSKLTASNNDLQKQVASLTAGNQAVNAEYSSYRTDCETTKKKYAAVQASIDEVNRTLEEVQRKLIIAMADFMDKGVEVYGKDGLVFVKMQDKLLYTSGSAVLSGEGKKALGSLANALNGYPSLKVYVVGNTDDKKFKNSNMDNLSLSTERANGVVRILRDDYKVDPTRLVPAGKGKYAPIADNATEEGRAKNRRIEIILNPDLVKLWQSSAMKN